MQMLGREHWAMWCNRLVVKIIIVVFPILALVGYRMGLVPFTHRSILAFVVEQSIVAVLMVLYELYTCTCGHHEYPGYLYQQN